MRASIPAILVLGVPGVALAHVVATSASGFSLKEEAVFEGTVEKAWDRVIHPARWWDPEHTYSGKAENLTLALQPGGCWCEKLAGGGFVTHMQVVLVKPREQLRLLGGLGPLQKMGATGALTFTLQPAGAGTRITVDYTVVVFGTQALDDLASAVDQVLNAQVQRLATLGR
jgi:uncharacterized protein YndB with AHSA1/START domain